MWGWVWSPSLSWRRFHLLSALCPFIRPFLICCECVWERGRELLRSRERRATQQSHVLYDGGYAVVNWPRELCRGRISLSHGQLSPLSLSLCTLRPLYRVTLAHHLQRFCGGNRTRIAPVGRATLITFSSHTEYVKRESIVIAWVKKKKILSFWQMFMIFMS